MCSTSINYDLTNMRICRLFLIYKFLLVSNSRVALMAYIYIFIHTVAFPKPANKKVPVCRILLGACISQKMCFHGEKPHVGISPTKGEPANNDDFLGGYEPPTKTNLCWQPPIIIVAGYGWVTLGAHPSGTWPTETWYREAGIKKHDVYRQIWGPHPVCVIFVCSPIFC